MKVTAPALQDAPRFKRSFFCPYCGEKLRLKNGFLFCTKQNVFIGKPETYDRWVGEGAFTSEGSSMWRKYINSIIKYIIFFTILFLGLLAYYHYPWETLLGPEAGTIEDKVFGILDKIFNSLGLLE